MSYADVKKRIFDDKLIAIVRGISKKNIINTVNALYAGGIRLIELTLLQDSDETIKNSLEMLRLVHDEFGDKIVLGAGTITAKTQAELAIKAGAEYILSPNTNEDVIRVTKEMGKVSIPGVLTPTEIKHASQLGADFVKLFPAGVFGTEYLKTIRSPLSNIPILAVGKINIGNMKSFLDAGAVGVGIGAELVDKNHIEAGDFDKIALLSAVYISKLKE